MDKNDKIGKYIDVNGKGEHGTFDLKIDELRNMTVAEFLNSDKYDDDEKQLAIWCMDYDFWRKYGHFEHEKMVECFKNELGITSDDGLENLLNRDYLEMAKDNCGAYEITGLTAAGVFALISLAESAAQIAAELKRANDDRIETENVNAVRDVFRGAGPARD